MTTPESSLPLLTEAPGPIPILTLYQSLGWDIPELPADSTNLPPVLQGMWQQLVQRVTMSALQRTSPDRRTLQLPLGVKPWTPEPAKAHLPRLTSLDDATIRRFRQLQQSSPGTPVRTPRTPPRGAATSQPPSVSSSPVRNSATPGWNLQGRDFDELALNSLSGEPLRRPSMPLSELPLYIPSSPETSPPPIIRTTAPRQQLHPGSPSFGLPAPVQLAPSSGLKELVLTHLKQQRLEGRAVNVVANQILRQDPALNRQSHPVIMQQLIETIREIAKEGTYSLSRQGDRFAISLPPDLDTSGALPVSSEQVISVWATLGNQLIGSSKFSAGVNCIYTSYPSLRSLPPDSRREMATYLMAALIREKYL